MAIHCTQCGAELPKDDARFCNKCGALVSMQPRNAPASRKDTVSPTLPRDPAKPALLEQVAHLPIPRPLPHPPRHEPPSWLSQLDREARHTPPEIGKVDRPEKSGERITGKSTFSSGEPATVDQEDADLPVREFRGKVWKQDEVEIPALVEEDADEEADDAPLMEEVEDLPTTSLPAGPPAIQIQRAATSPPITRSQDTLRAHVEQLDTVPVATPRLMRPVPPTPRIPESLSVQPQVGPDPAAFSRPSVSLPEGPSGVSHPRQLPPISQQVPSALPAQDWRQPQSVQMQPPPVSADEPLPTRRKSRKPLAFLLVLLLALGGTGVWVFYVQPFTIAPVTDPWQSFCNTGLGLSVQYPAGWSKQMTMHAVTFSDSNQGEQFGVVLQPATGGDVRQYLQETVTQQGLTSIQDGAPLAFAGASWQQVQGVLSVKGASFTEVLLAAVQGGQLVTVTQLAHQSIYSTDEPTVFSYMRSTFKFTHACA